MSEETPLLHRRPADAVQALGWVGLEPGAGAAELPFGPGDVTAGTETELQAAVKGLANSVDLPNAVESSPFYANIERAVSTGELPRSAIAHLERYLRNDREQVWENSWVRFPYRTLSEGARATFSEDLLYDRTDPSLGLRGDHARYLYGEGEERTVRVPVSYLLKLALADFLSSPNGLSDDLALELRKFEAHFLNDNTSPETTSIYVSTCSGAATAGREAATETGMRFLLTQLLLAYANSFFLLEAQGQRAFAYMSPLPPVRQRALNDCISDSMYRELFMSPCLSGWDRGEEKHEYMGLCHSVLSRSQLNTLPKLREAGIIRNNLVVLPNLSNTSLSNNGTHVSLGSVRLGDALSGRQGGKAASGEKYLGDLVTKIVEHFLPLFVGTYTAAPHRVSFADFHPERMLGFLPHELHYTHLRMMWRRWKGKADLRLFGTPLTPFGPRGLDERLSRLMGLKGDYLPDFRLLDYLVCLLSTHGSPGLDGTPGNWSRLKQDLAAMGVFHPKMATYLLVRQREYAVAGYAGFEGRHYSVFESFSRDLAPAIDLQQLLLCFAFKLAADGTVDHSDIPDTPFAESERRQIFFGSAAGLPTFFIKADSPNRFLKTLAARAKGNRSSGRYEGYVRVSNAAYRLALIDYLRTVGSEVVEALGMDDQLADLAERAAGRGDKSAESRLLNGILRGARAESPMGLDAMEFNLRAERYYRKRLRRRLIRESLADLENWLNGQGYHCAWGGVSSEVGAKALSREDLPPEQLRSLLCAVLMFLYSKKESARHGNRREASAVAASVR